MRAWSFITLGEDRQYGGNTGYQDELTSVYRFDSHVANHKRVAIGDFVILRDQSNSLGMARVVQITKSEGTKTVRRCPICQTTGIKARRTKDPAWRCSRKHEFDRPLEAEEPVTKYEAHFGDTFSTTPSAISATELKSMALRPSDQLSIEELDVRRIEDLVHGEGHARVVFQQALAASNEISTAEDGGELPAFVPSMIDQREQVLRAIKQRRGQAKFRDSLMKRYGRLCQITQCPVVDLLEAAHIIPYLGEHYNHPENGLLLRADIHTLFDLNLLMIEPRTYRVFLDPKVMHGEYVAFHGSTIVFAGPRPSDASLSVRWDAASSLRVPAN
jgi:putative restriction endonuclease